MVLSVNALLYRCVEAATNLVCIFKFETGDNLSLQLIVIRGLVQNALAKFGDVSLARLPEHRVQTII